MLTSPTVEKLRSMKMSGFLEAIVQQQEDTSSHELSFEERIGLLVDAEWMERENRKVARHLKAAKLRITGSCIEDIDYDAKRGISKSLMRKLATCKWAETHQNVILTGPTGVGKTYVACALGNQACRKGYKVLYRRLSRLFDELNLSRADGSYAKTLARFARHDVLILDDWGLAKIGEHQRRDLNEIMEDRYERRSTIITSQLPVAKWHDFIGEPTTADAICDRLLNNTHRIALAGASRRREKCSVRAEESQNGD
jgi:DNA replication protein DnaC